MLTSAYVWFVQAKPKPERREAAEQCSKLVGKAEKLLRQLSTASLKFEELVRQRVLQLYRILTTFKARVKSKLA